MPATTHGVLTPDEVLTVSINPGSQGIVIVNRSLEGVIWVRVDGEEPTVAGDDTYAVLGAREFPMSRRVIQSGPVTVKMISDLARAYSVEAMA